MKKTSAATPQCKARAGKPQLSAVLRQDIIASAARAGRS